MGLFGSIIEAVTGTASVSAIKALQVQLNRAASRFNFATVTTDGIIGSRTVSAAQMAVLSMSPTYFGPEHTKWVSSVAALTSNVSALTSRLKSALDDLKVPTQAVSTTPSAPVTPYEQSSTVATPNVPDTSLFLGIQPMHLAVGGAALVALWMWHEGTKKPDGYPKKRPATRRATRKRKR